MRLVDVTYENVKNVLGDYGYYHDEYKKFYDMSELLPTIEVPRWIPVTERLPDHWGHVLVFTYWNERWQTMIGWLGVSQKMWRILTPHGEYEYAAVTHWMPLPEPPNDGEVWERKFLGKWVGLHESN